MSNLITRWNGALRSPASLVTRAAATLVCGFILLASAAMPAAADEQIQHNKKIEGGDYARQMIFSFDAAKNCAESCASDDRCVAWTYEKTRFECRLKDASTSVVDDKCCDSGVKQVAQAPVDNDKQAFCADYAREAVAANRRSGDLGCGFQGQRWTGDYQAHLAYCLGNRRDASRIEADARAGDLQKCVETSRQEAEVRCDHYARMSMVQVDTAARLHCVLPQYDRRWARNLEAHKRACLEAPGKILASGIAEREAVLATCFDTYRDARRECRRYVDDALQQVSQVAGLNGCDVSGARWSNNRDAQLDACLSMDRDARRVESSARAERIDVCKQRAAKRQVCEQFADNAVQQFNTARAIDGCEVGGPRWSGNREEVMHACFDMDEGRRQAETDARAQQLAQCQEHGDRRGECRDYVDTALTQAQRNLQDNCGLQGPVWSTDRRQQFEFCRDAGRNQREAAIADRDAALRQCHNRVAVDPECDGYAKHSEHMAQVARERGCGGFEGFSGDYKSAYDRCLTSNPDERRRREKEKRAILQVCSLLHGFKLELGF